LAWPFSPGLQDGAGTFLQTDSKPLSARHTGNGAIKAMVEARGVEPRSENTS